MPSRKMTRRRRGKKPFKKFLTTAEQALRVANGVRKLLNVEFKLFDHVETSTAVGNSGTLVSLNNMAQGDNSNNRGGLSVRNKTLQFKYYCEQHASATNTFVRIVLLIDKNPNGSLVSVSDIFSENRITGHLHNKHLQRFNILSEQLISLNASSTDGSIGKKFIRLENHTKYDESAEQNDNIERNQILLYMISNEATNTPTVHWSTRLRYIDN